MNAHVDFKSNEADIIQRMVARHIIKQQSKGSWTDLVGGCDDCSTVPVDSAAAGRTRSLVLENGRLVMRDDAPRTIFG